MLKSSDTRIVFNLKSSSVELAIVDFTGTQPNILFSKTEILPFKEKLDSGGLKEKTFETIDKMLGEAISKNMKDLNDCKRTEIIFYSPWFLPELVLEEHKGKKAKLKEIFNQKVKPPQQPDYLQIENKITNIKVNGYSLETLKDIETEDVEINVFRSFVSKDTVKRIEQVIQKRLRHLHDFSFSSSNMLIFESIKNLFFDTDNFVFINVGEEITEIGVSQEDALEFITTVPNGINEFSRKIETFTDQKNNLDSLSFLSEKQTDENLSPDAKKISELKNDLLNKILESLKQNYKELPRRIFISTKSSNMNFVKMILSKDEVFKENDLFFLDKDLFKEKVYTLDTKPLSNVEYLLTAYYLSIKK